MRIILYYNFLNEYSNEGRESIRVTVKDFPFEVKIKKSEGKMTVNELYEKYKGDAVKAAAYSKRLRIGNDMANSNIFK